MIAPGVTLLCLPDSRFKRVVFQVHFDRPMCSRRSARTLLLPVLQQGSSKRPRRMDVARALEENYGSQLGLGATRVGERHRVSLRASWVGDSFLPEDESCLSSMVSLGRDLLESPLRGNGDEAFQPESVERERAQLLRQIESLPDDKPSWAEERFLASMCADEAYGLPPWGTQETVRALTLDDLEDARQDILTRSEVNIVAVGPVDSDSVEREMTAWFGVGGSAFSEEREICPPASTPHASELKEFREELPADQARFLFGFRYQPSSDIAEREAMALAASILGGGSQGRLFRIIREERSLAYGIYAGLRTLKGMLVVEAGIDAKVAQSVQQEVLAQISDLAANGPQEGELDLTRAGLMNNLQSVGDSAASLASYWEREHDLGLMRTPASRAQSAQRVSNQQIAEAAQLWEADTVFLLAGPEEEE